MVGPLYLGEKRQGCRTTQEGSVAPQKGVPPQVLSKDPAQPTKVNRPEDGPSDQKQGNEV